MSTEAVKAEWVPVPEDLEPGEYVAIFDEWGMHDCLLSPKDGKWYWLPEHFETPDRLLAVNGQIVRIG